VISTDQTPEWKISTDQTPVEDQQPQPTYQTDALKGKNSSAKEERHFSHAGEGWPDTVIRKPMCYIGEDEHHSWQSKRK